MRVSLGSWAILPLVGCTSSNPAFDTGSTPTAAGSSSEGSRVSEADAGTGASAGPMTASSGGGVDGGSEMTSAMSGPTASDERVEFTDALEEEFSEGTWSSLQWQAGYLELVPGVKMGSIQSRIFDAGEATTWETLEWTPRAPYGKPLPNDGASEFGYVVDSIDMSGIELLLHLNNIESSGGVDRVRDRSGSGRDGVVVGSGVEISDEPGPFGGSLRVENLFSYVEFPSEMLAPGSADFTWALWFRGTQCASANHMLMIDSPTNQAETTTIWLGCGPCEQGQGVQFGIRRGNVGPVGCFLQPVFDGAWHHIALVKTGHPGVDASVYFDGSFVGGGQAGDVGALELGGDEVLTLAGGDDGSYPGVGEYDEVAIWSREFTANEVQALYRRGAQRLRVQVRSCDAADCAGTPFVGPSGDPETAFRDPAGVLQPGQRLSLPSLEGRYVQYQAEFALWSPTVPSPGLAAITIRGAR